jgi:glycosyltransferase involved in cell wall biosynthesis
MKKIAHFIDSDDPGGAETLVIDMCRQLNRDGYDSQVWHFGNQWLVDQCREYRIPAVRLPGHRFYKSIKTLPVFTLIFANFIRKQKIDLLHSHLLDSVASGSIAAFLAGVPHVGTLHDTYTLAEKKKKVYLLRAGTFLGSKLITVSEQMRRYVEALSPFPKGAIEVILNGTDLDKFLGGPPQEMRRALGLPAEETVLIAVGRVVEIKGYDTLIEAFGHLRPAAPLRLLIVGDGSEMERYRDLIAKKGLDGKVVLLGQRGDVPDLLKISDCFVLASRSEGLSCSIIEAMAAGLPVVATDVGGNAELVADGISGYLVPSDAPVLLAEKLNDLISDRNKRKQFGMAGFEKASNQLSLDAMMRKYRALYDKLSGG